LVIMNHMIRTAIAAIKSRKFTTSLTSMLTENRNYTKRIIIQ
jgi:hypothetical protein